MNYILQEQSTEGLLLVYRALIRQVIDLAAGDMVHVQEGIKLILNKIEANV